MGKHERKQIGEAEKIIVKILNNHNLNDFDRKNRWFRHAVAIAEKIKRDFSSSLSRHLGNRYDNTGDLSLISVGREIYIEVKMSDTKSGVGTEANVSQDALTENNLFVGKVKSWSEFRHDMKHDKWILNYLDGFSNYPSTILKISNSSSIMKEEKARYLRALKEKGDKKATQILNSIHKRDKKEKMNYLSYLSKQSQQQEMVKRFFILIILGIHKKEEIKNLITKDNLFQEIQNLHVYYSNLNNNQIIVRKEDLGERIKKNLVEFSQFKIIFPKGLTHCKIVGVRDKALIPLLQIVFHWKNIAQGIKTPCINIFDLTAVFD